MSDEEKKAIENTELILKEWQKIVDIKDDMERDIEMNCYSEEMPFFEMKTLLKLVKKQQKEIKELNSDLEVFKKALTDIEVVYNKDYISKDKIRELLKEIQETMCPMCCECGLCEELEKILEENNND